jgi:transposase InsO family protein
MAVSLHRRAAMPWLEVSTMSQRREFVMFAQADDANLSALCARYGISRKTGYKWLRRFAVSGVPGLCDRSCRPLHVQRRTPPAMAQALIALRRSHPAWGARKLRRRLQVLGHVAVPAPSTVHGILQRHGLIVAGEAAHAWQRFEHAAPNQLWQMDFKGHIAMQAARCHPLTVLDDHSRFSVCLHACADETGATVQTRLTHTFERYGLPDAMTMDNGAPWGSDPSHPGTALTLWLMRLNIRITHSRPYHPQTQGKDERFHRTLKAEVLCGPPFGDFDYAQQRFDAWREVYNFERPHEALGQQVPASRYRHSVRAFPGTLPPIEYGPDDLLRKVQDKGEFSFRGQTFRVSKCFHGYPIALRPTHEDGKFSIYFCTTRIGAIDLSNPDL